MFSGLLVLDATESASRFGYSSKAYTKGVLASQYGLPAFLEHSLQEGRPQNVRKVPASGSRASSLKRSLAVGDSEPPAAGAKDSVNTSFRGRMPS